MFVFLIAVQSRSRQSAGNALSRDGRAADGEKSRRFNSTRTEFLRSIHLDNTLRVHPEMRVCVARRRITFDSRSRLCNVYIYIYNARDLGDRLRERLSESEIETSVAGVECTENNG